MWFGAVWAVKTSITILFRTTFIHFDQRLDISNDICSSFNTKIPQLIEKTNDKEAIYQPTSVKSLNKR